MTRKHPKTIGNYDVLGPLGKGAMGEVFRAVQPSLNRVVAIKVLPRSFADDPKQVERFHREAEAIAMLNHPNVVQIIDKDHDGDQLYFVMEYVPGTTLDQVLKQRRLSLREALMVFRGVCNGLQAAHQQSIVHRDLNPRNILVSEDLRTVKLADFGISQIESISRERGTLSTSEVSLGTLHYIAPEQARDMAGTDHRSDIYSVGVLLYEMLTGKVPVGRFNLPSEINSEVPSDIDPIVLRCLAAEAEERYPEVGELLTQISNVEERLKLGLVHELHGLSHSTSKILKRSSTTIVRNKKKWLGLLAAAGLVLFSVFAWQSVRRAPSPETGEAVASETGSNLQLTALERYSAGVEDLAGSSRVAASSDVSPPPLELAAPSDVLAETAVAEAPAPAVEREAESTVSTEELDARASPASPAGSAIETELRVVRDKVKAKLYEPALVDLEQIFVRHGSDPAAAEAFLLKSQIEQAQGNQQEALATYVELGARYPGSAAEAEALFRRGQLLLQAKGRDRQAEARNLFDEVVQRFSRSRWAPEALAAKAGTEEDRRKTARDSVLGTNVPPALLTFRTLVESYPTHRATEGARWRLGAMYEDLKRFDLAAATYTDLASRFPKTRFDAWWKAGQVYDRRLDDPAKARDAYAKVPSTSSQYADAQKRMQKLSN